MELDDVVIILCRPSEPGNAGAVCRAMKNSGLRHLRLVAPANMEEAVVRARCVHAEDVWESAVRFESLPAAIADCAIVVGTTRRRGKNRKTITMTPHAAALFLKNFPAAGKAALVFGNERTGLETEELALCNAASHIPANDAFPSLNLSHSVQIFGYELYAAFAGDAPQNPSSPQGTWEPLPRTQIDTLTTAVCDSLAALGFYTHQGRELHEEFFRDIFARAGLTPTEAQYMQKIFAKAARLGNR